MIKLKQNIINAMLWTAIIIILMHGIVPHHHYFGMEDLHNICTDESALYSDNNCKAHSSVFTIQHNVDNKHECDECHFKLELTLNFFKKHNTFYTGIVEKNSIISTLLSVSEFFFYTKTKKYCFTFPISHHLRAPPQYS